VEWLDDSRSGQQVERSVLLTLKGVRLAGLLIVVSMLAACEAEPLLSGEGEQIEEPQAPGVPSDFEITAEYLGQGTTSLGIPGTTAFITLDPARNLVVCTTGLSGGTQCYPDDPFERSACPDTERCAYLVYREETGPFVVSVFNMNLMGQGIAESVLNSISENLGEKSPELAGPLGEARTMNDRRALWLSSFIISDESLDPFDKGKLETIAREAVMARAMPRTVDPEEGALSSPFETCFDDGSGVWECQPLREVSLRAIALGD
jgi:hypothetical protein